MNLKPPLTYREQICKLKSENILIENEVEALNLLSCISYYRLSGYALSFRLTPSQSIYQNNTSLKPSIRFINSTNNYVLFSAPILRKLKFISEHKFPMDLQPPNVHIRPLINTMTNKTFTIKPDTERL